LLAFLSAVVKAARGTRPASVLFRFQRSNRCLHHRAYVVGVHARRTSRERIEPV